MTNIERQLHYIVISSPLISQLTIKKPIIYDLKLPLFKYVVEFKAPENEKIHVVTFGRKSDTREIVVSRLNQVQPFVPVYIKYYSYIIIQYFIFH